MTHQSSITTDARPPTASGIDLTVSAGQIAGTTSIVVREGKLFEQVGSVLGVWMKRRYTEAAALGRLKALSFAGLLALLGGGLTLKAMGSSVGIGLKSLEFVVAAPGLTEMLCGSGALLFVVSMDVWCMFRRRADERRYWDIAANPNTPVETRDALLEQLRRQ